MNGNQHQSQLQGEITALLLKHKGLLILTALLALVVSTTYVLLRPPAYQYSQLIEIGHHYSDNGKQALVSIDDTKARIGKALLPEILEQINAKHTRLAISQNQISLQPESETLLAITFNHVGFYDKDYVQSLLSQITHKLRKEENKIIEYKKTAFKEELQLLERNKNSPAQLQPANHHLNHQQSSKNSNPLDRYTEIANMRAAVKSMTPTHLYGSLIIAPQAHNPSNLQAVILSTLFSVFSAMMAVVVFEFLRAQLPKSKTND